MEDPFSHLDATGMAALVRSGQASALELTDAAISWIERLDPALNILASHDFDRARERTRR